MRMKLLATAAVAALFAGGGVALAQQQPMSAPENGAGQNQMNNQQPMRHRANPASQTEQPGAQDQNGPNRPGAVGPSARPGDEDRMRSDQRSRTDMRGNEMNRSMMNRSTTRTNVENRTNVQNRATNVNITETQRTRIRHDIIEGGRGPRAEHVNFQLNVGVQVPRTVRIVAVPQEIVEINPAWEQDEYFISGDQIVIVDPATFAIVAVLPV